jgi:hypothetical protein
MVMVNRRHHLIPIEELFKPDTKILAGHNRHEALLWVMESLVSRNKSILPLDKIKDLARQLNTEQLCDPPLNDREFEKQWKCAIEFIVKNNGNGNGNGQAHNGSSATNTEREQDHEEQQQSKPKEFTVFKYSLDIPLAEEINLAGVNKFLQIIDDDSDDDGTDSSGTNKKKKKPVISDKIDLSEEKHIILKPS